MPAPDRHYMTEGDRQRFFKIGLLSLCEDLRTQASGASDPWTRGQVYMAVSYLKERLKSWHSSAWFAEPYDNAVKALIIACLAELKLHEVE